MVFSRGTCFFSTKVAAGQDLGYDAVIIGQSHGATRNGILTDGFTCGGQGHNYDEQIPAVCTGHRAMHLLFNDPPQYTGPEATDMSLGTIGDKYQASGVFDGWGYLNLHDATKPNLPIIGTYAVPESLDPAFRSGFGILSIHEIKTDPREENLGYISYYNAGFRVVRFNKQGIFEVGRFIDTGGNDFWGGFPIGDETVGHGYSGPIDGDNPFVLASDAISVSTSSATPGDRVLQPEGPPERPGGPPLPPRRDRALLLGPERRTLHTLQEGRMDLAEKRAGLDVRLAW